MTPESTELQSHFGPASECEGAEKEDEVDEEDTEFVPVLAPHADDSGTAADPSHSAVTALHLAQSQEHQRSHHQMGAQLGRLKQETNRCMRAHLFLSNCKSKLNKDMIPSYISHESKSGQKNDLNIYQ